jgi:ribosomal protein S18 acetylase RimI-like enzyme
MTDARVRAVEVRRVDASLWKTYRGVRLAMLLDTPRAYGSTFAREVALSDQQWQDRMAQSTSWLAISGELPVGAVTLYRFPEQAPDEACLVAMWVAPHARGTGVADALARALLDHAKQRRLRRVTLDVADENTAAIRFYERMGFVRTGRTGTLPHDLSVTEFEMVRSLGDEPADSP